MIGSILRSLSGRRLHAVALGLSTLACVAASSAMAAASAGAWQGNFRSNALARDVTVRLEISAAGDGELRFTTLDCKVGLRADGPAGPSGAAYAIVPTNDAAGAYCGTWLGGRLETQPIDGGTRLTLAVTNRKSAINVRLSPAAAP